MTDAAISDQSVDFVGRRTALFWLLVKNGLLTLVTLGIYRFWAKTHIRRYFWNNITIAGDRLEYLGRPIELLIGFLIAIVILLPLGLLASGTIVVVPFLDTFSLVVLYWLGLFAFYRVRRYRLTRTTWRGIRAGQTGSAVRYAFLRLGLTVLSVLTLGLTYPWGRVTLHRYVLPNTRFGNASVDFNGKVWPLYRNWIPVQVSIAAVIAIFAFSAVDIVIATQLAIDSDSALFPSAFAPFAGMTIFFWVGSIMFIRFRVAEVRYLLQNSSLAGARASSALSSLTIFWRAIVSGLIYSAVAAVLAIIAGIVGGIMVAIVGITPGGEFNPSIFLTPEGLPTPAVAFGATIVFVVFALVFLFVISIIKTVFFWAPVLRRFCETLSPENIQAIDQVIQSTTDDPKYGEGLADALSFDALPI